MSDNIPSKPLSADDIKLLLGRAQIPYIEPSQVYWTSSGVEEKTSISAAATVAQKVDEVVAEADFILSKVSALQKEIDSRCKRFSVAGGIKGSPLYQAMFRVFGERTDTITYDHYKRALEIRKTLIAEDAKELKAR